jgi:DNA-binding IclR family transcriptional regulator
VPRLSNVAGSTQRQPLAKALRILEVLAEALPSHCGVREVATSLGLPTTSVHRVLRHLHAEGIIESDTEAGRYRLAPRFLRLAWTATARFPLRTTALPIMRELVDEVDETAFLAIYDPGRMEMTLAARVDSNHPLQYMIELNRWLPIYAGAGGLGIMAFLPPEERRTVVRRTGLKPITQHTETDPVKLERLMSRFRRQGYARTSGQRVLDAVGMSAPIWGPDERVVGDIVLTIPRQRFKASHERELATKLILCADKISAAINGRRPPSLAALNSKSET